MSNHQKVTKYQSSTNGYMMGCLWVLGEVYLIGHMLGTHDGCMMNINYVNVCKCTYKMGLNGCFHSNSSSDVKILHPSPLKGRTTTSRSAPNIYNSHEITKQKDAILNGITL